MDLNAWKKKRKTIQKETDESKIKKSLKYSIIDGSFYSAMVGFGESFFSAFATFLSFSTFQIGILGSLPQTLGSLIQLFSEKLLRLFNSRKKFVCTSAFLQALMYIPIALVFFFGKFSIPLLILFVSLYFIFGMIAGSAWSSWMGDMVSGEERGSYFSRRNTIAGSISFISLLLAGWTLQQFTSDLRTQYIGFATIFALALTFRIFSLIYLIKKFEPKYIPSKDDQTGFITFLKQAPSRGYGLFIIFLCLMNFSIYIAGPYFAAYMLYDLKLSYFSYTLLVASAVVSKYFAMPIWGKAVDRYGTKKVLTLSGVLMPFVPIPWIFSGNLGYLAVAQMFSGFAWAGFEIASFNFFFDTIIPQKRSKYMAYYNVLNGIALFAGAMVGGLLIKYNFLSWSDYYTAFLLSGILRYIIFFMFISRLREIRAVDHITYPKLLFHIVTTMTTRGLIYEAIMLRKKNKFKLKKKIV